MNDGILYLTGYHSDMRRKRTREKRNNSLSALKACSDALENKGKKRIFCVSYSKASVGKKM